MSVMGDDDVLHYPRGFLLADSSIDPPGAYVAGPVLSDFWVHPWTETEAAEAGEQFVVVLGTCVVTSQECWEEPASILLSALQVGETEFFSALAEFAGRHAVIFGSRDQPRIVTDATGMRSVFYAEEAPIAASHALLVEETLGGRPLLSQFPVHYGAPGNRTLYPRTRILTPNTYLDLRHSSVRRFWPTRAPSSRDVEEVAKNAVIRATRALKTIARSHRVRLALTAGLDSRVMLAIALRSGIDFETYTYGDRKDTALDRSFAGELAARVGIGHSVIPSQVTGKDLSRRLAEAHYLPHHVRVVSGLMEWFPDHRMAAVTANLLEIGRCFFAPMERHGAPEPVTAEAMAELHRLKMRASMQRKIERFGVERWMEVETEAFGAFIDDTDWECTLDRIDPFDLFYWEHRMGTWHGPAMNERDFYAEAFIPLNSRQCFEELLGIERNLRESGAVFYRMIEEVDPSLLDLPVNPRRWPR